jgi:hypothetical protein
MTRNDCRGPSSSSTINNVPRRLRNVVLSPSTGLLLAINGSVVKVMSEINLSVQFKQRR